MLTNLLCLWGIVPLMWEITFFDSTIATNHYFIKMDNEENTYEAWLLRKASTDLTCGDQTNLKKVILKYQGQQSEIIKFKHFCFLLWRERKKVFLTFKHWNTSELSFVPSDSYHLSRKEHWVLLGFKITLFAQWALSHAYVTDQLNDMLLSLYFSPCSSKKRYI